MGGREGGPEYEIRPSLKDFTFAGSQWLSSVLLTPGSGTRGAEQRGERPAGRAKAEAESVVLENRDGNFQAFCFNKKRTMN